MKALRMEEMTAPAINDAIARGFTTAVIGRKRGNLSRAFR